MYSCKHAAHQQQPDLLWLLPPLLSLLCIVSVALSLICHQLFFSIIYHKRFTHPSPLFPHLTCPLTTLLVSHPLFTSSVLPLPLHLLLSLSLSLQCAALCPAPCGETVQVFLIRSQGEDASDSDSCVSQLPTYTHSLSLMRSLSLIHTHTPTPWVMWLEVCHKSDQDVTLFLCQRSLAVIDVYWFL